MQFDFHANQSHFHKNGFALTLALKQRHKGTWKWPIQNDKTKQNCFLSFLFFLLLFVIVTRFLCVP